MNSNSAVGIIAGEDIDMPAEFINQNAISLYNFNITWDGILQDRKEIYKKMREFKRSKEVGTPLTSQPSMGLFKELFETALQKYDEVFVVSISSKLSGCYNSALQASQMLEASLSSRLHLVDSLVSSAASGFFVNEIVNGIKNNLSSAEILKNTQNLHEKVRLVAMIEDSYWLQKGGRISPAIALIMNQMKKIDIRPLLTTKEGKVVLLNVRTKAKNKVTGIFDFLNEELKDKKVELVITHADALSEAQELARTIKENKRNIDILYIEELSPVFGAHVGPDTLVVNWKEL